VICHCLLNGGFGLFHTEYDPVMGNLNQHVGDTKEWDLATILRLRLRVP
jgi:hypothetical protein